MTFLRVLPFEIAPGPHNMAADEALLQTAINGQASLRFYAWNEATVSLGYFQPAAARFEEPLLANLPFVRRPSGGSTLVHHHEVTYSLALPAYELTTAPSQTWMPRMHRILLQALARLGVTATLAGETPERHGPVLCFQHFTPGDVLCQGRKIVGSAQRKQRQCLMQHGGILLRQSEYTPELPGIAELSGKTLEAYELMNAVILAFEEETGWQASPNYWNPQEQSDIQLLIETRYGTKEWNEKR